MSLLENHPRLSSRQKHRSSLPPLATMSLFQDQSSLSSSQQRRHHHHHHQGRRHTKHRLSNASTLSYTSTNSTSTPSTFMLTPRSFNNTFELVFTNLIDALIFTSAIAITAYNYWMGYIADPPRIYGSPTTTTTTSPPKTPSPCVLLKPLDIPSPPLSVLSSPSSPTPATTSIPADASSKLDPTWSDLKRTPESVSSHKRLHSQENDAGPSLPPPPPLQDEKEDEQEQEEQEERVNRMEETLQELIRQGQAALTSPIDWN